MHKLKIIAMLIIAAAGFSNCSNNDNNYNPVSITDTITPKKTAPPKQRKKPAATGYHFEKTKLWRNKNNTAQQYDVVLALNRTDSAHLAKMDSVIVPNDTAGDIEFYLPFPLHVAALEPVNKIILFSYPTQSFAAYEAGELQYTGQTNMGRKNDTTPTGLFFTNWKAEKTTSTFNDEWDLRWNFNIENKLGVGFHQYELPGYPASHSCLRLTEKDARFLYDWADQWILGKQETLLAKGTAVIVFGSYDFKAPKPWLKLVKDPHALDISEALIEQQVHPFIPEIIKEQENRAKIDRQPK
jgi:hypothetical protein